MALNEELFAHLAEGSHWLDGRQIWLRMKSTSPSFAQSPCVKLYANIGHRARFPHQQSRNGTPGGPRAIAERYNTWRSLTAASRCSAWEA